MDSPRIISDRQDRILTLTINRPEKRNALSLALLDDLASCINAHREDPAIACVVITGAGDRCFAAGGDLVELDAVREESQAHAMGMRARTALDAVRYFPSPVVASLNGYALGGGAELAAACDLRVAASHARIGFIQSTLNVSTAWGAAADLIAMLGPQQTLKLLIEGRILEPEEAERMGLVDYVCAPQETLSEGLGSLTDRILSRGTAALRAFKAVAAEGRRVWHDRIDSVEQDGMVTAWVHEDHWAAASAILGDKKDG